MGPLREGFLKITGLWQGPERGASWRVVAPKSCTPFSLAGASQEKKEINHPSSNASEVFGVTFSPFISSQMENIWVLPCWLKGPSALPWARFCVGSCGAGKDPAGERSGRLSTPC